jgi:hypothetical protein
MRRARAPFVYYSRDSSVAEEVARALGGTEVRWFSALDPRRLRGRWRSFRDAMRRRISSGGAVAGIAESPTSGIRAHVRHKRSVIPGATDYTGVALPDIVADIRGWSRMCDAVSARLVTCELDLARYGRPQAARAAERIIDHFTEVMARYQRGFEHLAAHLPSGVGQSDVEIATELYESTKIEYLVCTTFERSLALPSGGDLTEFGGAPARACACVQEAMLDMRDLGNVLPRLRILMGPALPKPQHAVSLA